MIKYLVFLMLLAPTIYNYIIHRNNIMNIKNKSIYGFILAIFAAVASALCYKLDNTVLGYAIAISAVLLIYTVIFFPGIRKDGFNIFLGATPILKIVSFDKVKSVGIKSSKNNDLELTIKAHGDTYSQTYDLKDKDFIIKNIEGKTNLKINI
ncbi:hypothetical protein [Anaerococcus octavius]|uniref:hypothetical protein n=1 Tax=Anaerococcus octavius TaxID=54007 RepID=UPI0027B8CB3C|nr:hypothetical protein [Anaerococcus octavius]